MLSLNTSLRPHPDRPEPLPKPVQKASLNSAPPLEPDLLSRSVLPRREAAAHSELQLQEAEPKGMLASFTAFLNRRRVCRTVAAVDRAFNAQHRERSQFRLSTLAASAWHFVKSDVKEKAANLLHFRKLARETWRQSQRYGKSFARFALIAWLCDDFIVPGALWLMNQPTLAAITLFGHFEWITYPSYFLAVALKQRYWKSRPTRAEYLSLMERVREALGEKKCFSERWRTANDFLKHNGQYVMGMFIEDLSAPYDPVTASACNRLGRREQAAKFLGRALRVCGAKSPLGRESFHILLKHADDTDPWVRKAVAGAFGKFSNKLEASQQMDAWEALHAHLSPADEPEVTVRGAAARSLGAFPSLKTARLLAAILSDSAEHWWVRRYAAGSLGEVLPRASNGHGACAEVSAAAQELCRSTDAEQEKSIEVRSTAALALAKLPREDKTASGALLSRHVREALLKALGCDPDATVREAALWALTRRAAAGGDPAECTDWARQLAALRDKLDPNLKRLSGIFLHTLEPCCKKGAIESPAADAPDPGAAPRPKGVFLLAVDSLLRKDCRDKCYQLDTPAVQDFVHQLRREGHAVFYSRNFLQDRSDAELQPDGSIDLYSSFATQHFHRVIDRLKQGRPAAIPWIDFPRGKVAAQRTILPPQDGFIVVAGTKAELEELAPCIGLKSEDINAAPAA